ncbi:MAG: hypothetical protein Q9220_005675 [cf. Caloplaca sp. 1 TL-2023]
MKTSRVARETATISRNSEIGTRRQTRSFAASINTFAAGSAFIKPEDEDGDSSSLSSAASPAPSFDIEDIPQTTKSQKRKRGIASPATVVNRASTVETTVKASPRYADIKTEDVLPAKVKKGRKQPAKKVTNDVGEVEIHPPTNWEVIYTAVQEMRKKVLAPVDTMGCESLAEESWSPRDKRFQTLIALMLSSQTKDTTTALAIRNLQTTLPPPHGFSLEGILAVPATELNNLIYAVGFHNNKTQYIKKTALILSENFNSEIPDTIEGLMSLPGVGPKMAYLCMSAAWGRTEGIGVDVHVHRITNLWGWHKTRNPEETRACLEAWLPKEKWHEINHLLVGFGQTICLPVGRKCGECTLSTRGLCPGAVAQKQKVVKKVKKEEVLVREGEEGVKKEEVDEVLVKAEDV